MPNSNEFKDRLILVQTTYEYAFGVFKNYWENWNDHVRHKYHNNDNVTHQIQRDAQIQVLEEWTNNLCALRDEESS